MKKSIRSIIVILLFVCAIVAQEAYGEEEEIYDQKGEYCYEPYGDPVTPEFLADMSLVHFNWIEGERGMAAYASYVYDEETNSTICVVTARIPDEVIGDPDMDSFGHEVLHCATGDFHPGEH